MNIKFTKFNNILYVPTKKIKNHEIKKKHILLMHKIQYLYFMRYYYFRYNFYKKIK